MNDILLKKYHDLKEYIKELKSVAVAFSSGVDSTLLLYAAYEALGKDVLAVTASSNSFPEREYNESKEYCQQLGIKQIIVQTDELKIEGFVQNPPNRCYLCKKEIFTKLKTVAAQNNKAEVLEGTNLDDDNDYRPGMQAIAELGIKSPLRKIGFTKKEIRELSEHLGLPTWNKQSFACLSTRFPYGEEITAAKLIMVDKAEQLLLDMGFHQLRVRIHSNVARIELPPEEFDRFMEEATRKKVYTCFKEYGFDYVALDLLGYRTGSMNEVLNLS